MHMVDRKSSHLAHSTSLPSDSDDRAGAQESSPAVAPTPRKTDRTIALLLFALSLALYVRGGARDVLPGDPGEFQFAAWNFGVAHATGYPLYLMLGGVWQHLLGLLGVNPAHALNLFSALLGASAVALLYLLTVRWTPGPVAIRRAAAVVAAAYLATNPTFWSQALIAEVYTLHALFVVLMLLAFQSIERAPAGRATPVWLALVVGLSLTHHATTVLLLPALAVGLWMVRDRLTRAPGAWLLAVVALVGPLLLYLYLPLRATPTASPWYFPTLGNETLALFEPTVGGIWAFITGRSISVGFGDLGYAAGSVGDAWTLWRIHIGWAGFVVAALGVYSMWRNRRRAALMVTVLAVVALQLFNLFYAIEDILVYYIPLYVIACLWIGFGAAQIGMAFNSLALGAEATTSTADSSNSSEQEKTESSVNWEMLGVVVIAALLYFPLRQASGYMMGLDQSAAQQARQMWETVLAGNPESGAILISNDRNEIVPLYYLQQVEDRRADLTGIFPLVAPEARFADIGATTATALASGAPVYLVKSMPGFDVRFALEPAGESLVRVAGNAVDAPAPQIVLNQQYGPLTLLGIDLLDDSGQNSLNITQNSGIPAVRLYWRVDAGLPAAYTTTVQLFDADANRIGQSDAAAGGIYYPTSLWKPGEILVENHTLQPSNTESASSEGASSEGASSMAASLLVGMYSGADLAQLAPPILIDLSAE